MKVIYAYKEGMEPIYIKNSKGTQRILIVFQDQAHCFVHFADDYLRHTYLNRLINPMAADRFVNENLARIETDAEFYHYLGWINDNYNYSGLHMEEKLDGADVGGPILDLRGF